MKYDVFISYSRKDYVDERGNVITNNMLSKIKKLFKANGISYWFDEDGIYSGDEFASVLTKAIRDSKIFLFISSVNSNQSKWTSNEISTALEFKKIIIPFRLDESPYNDSVMMKIVSYDYIECQDEKKALSKLLIAVKHHLSSETNAYCDSGNKTASEKGLTEDHPKLTNKRIIQWTVLIVLSLVAIGGVIAFYNRGDHSVFPQIATIHEESNSNVCQPVDLGLTSGTMWADRNVGAANISDFGDLYAWGETSKKKDYSQGLYNPANKPKTSITSAKYDVATFLWGEAWTIPTEKQFRELLVECQWQWTRIKGHYGYLITGKNGNQLFLPAAGWICSKNPDYQNTYGYYWTTDRVVSNPQFARSLQFPQKGKAILGNGFLYYGRSIRAVYSGIAVAE